MVDGRMPKSPLAKGFIEATSSKDRDSITRLELTAPYKRGTSNVIESVDISRLVYRECNEKNEQIRERIAYIRRFSKKANDESPRVCQRLNNLRNWNYEKIKSLYIRIS